MDSKIFIEIPFPNEHLATIAKRVMNVDEELKTDQVKRVITSQDNLLQVHFECYNTKMLRVAVNSFLEYLSMVTRTMEADFS
ncbi:CTAG/Pcc1 family [Cokeromyces recurvatus]|uniref:CTAG/Pcc1 family n=1 Tax=Cokeromyces recurvatus TaxID=90255 RepID=UPI0022203998|nr:CTAG/Pcc1 family [Cokeromyces recurvatus]KAI7906860.1 CTAG/Pcc1 family [Cokeromyces recurvatus]